MNFINEISCHQLGMFKIKAKVRCTVFKDNSGALELAIVPKTRQRTKHINNKHNHFRSSVHTGRIDVQAISIKDQLADVFTKVLDQNEFQYLPRKLMGW